MGEDRFSPIIAERQPERALQRDQQGKMDAIGAILHVYSLIQRNAQEATLGVHRLVQAVIREAMAEAERQTWVRRTVQVVKEALPEITFAQWRQCEQYVPHAQACVQEMAGMNGEEEAQMWDWIGAYLLERQRTQEAGPYVQQALSLRERTLGSEHVRTATSLDLVAQWWNVCGGEAVVCANSGDR